MSDSSSRLHRRPSLDQLRKQAKDLLREYRAGEAQAQRRFAAAIPRPALPASPSLADAQFVLARELGFEVWASLKRALEGVDRYRDRYSSLAEDLASAGGGDPGAAQRLDALFGDFSRERLLAQFSRRLGVTIADAPTLAQSRLFVAKLYGFESWEELQDGIEESTRRPRPSHQGLSASPPFYKIDRKERLIEPSPPLAMRDWEEIFDVMRENGITSLRTPRMTDAALARLAKLDFVTSLQLEGSRQVTDAGLRHLAQMPQLERLNLTGCGMTDRGLSVLRQLERLREFSVFHHGGVSDVGLANLAFCDQLEKVELLGCPSSGDGLLRALESKPRLRHLKSGNALTDAGLALLHRFPVFKNWQGGEPEMSLMSFDAEPNFLLLRGAITDQGMETLAGLNGLYALNLDDSNLSISSAGLRSLAGLPQLNWLGFDAKDETMDAIAELPHLRMLMCQDTVSTDAGFIALSRSRTLEFLWGRRCYGLTGVGFSALSRLPALRGLSVSCKNVDDAGLSALPHFPALTQFMPMDVDDEGFRHIGQCEKLEDIWCMYCRDTGDAATQCLSGLKRLKTYYAGQTRITDRSLKILGHMPTLERLSFWNCPGVTDAGIQALTLLPALRELTVSQMPNVSRKAIDAFPPKVHVTYEL